MVGNYYELTIKQFLKCKTISELETDPLQRKISMLAELSGKTVDEIESMPISDLQKHLAKFSSIDTLEPNSKVKMRIKVNGKTFDLIWKSQEMTAYQYIDTVNFCKDPVNNIHNILASLACEVTWYGKRLKYNGATHKERADLFYNEMKIKQAYPIMVFFCKYLKELVDSTQDYLIAEAERVKQMVEKHFHNAGDGL
jgi:hypothetical protein